MNAQVQFPTPGYEIDVEPLSGRVTAYRGDVVLASTTRARVLYETRCEPVIYFPIEDLAGKVDCAPDRRSYCPFKGSAICGQMEVGGETIPQAVWRYDLPLPDTSDIDGYVAFVPGVVTRMDLGHNIIRQRSDTHMSGPLVDWLVRDAGRIDTPEGLTAALADKLAENGVSLTRMSIMIWSLHPLIAGKNYVWRKGDDGTGSVSTYAPSYEIHDHAGFANSPLRHVSNGMGGVRQRLTDTDTEDMFPIMADLRALGGTDYVAMPLKFSDGRINVLTLTSDHPNGFTTASLGLIFECAPAISRFYEVFMQRENAQALLETYVGKRSGARVLGGEIRRGDGDEIDAAIMFVDLRNSTRLESELGRSDYIRLLNEFFETVSDVVHGNGGEVLKFIGDAVLAVFPAEGDFSARGQALASARQIITMLDSLPADGEAASEAAIGIAYGRVTYGNVGSRERLDFTVIGEPANIAARLADYAKEADYPIVVTADVVPPKSSEDIRMLGALELHNIARPVPAAAVTPLGERPAVAMPPVPLALPHGRYTPRGVRH
ncbi:DUF427 domain-containing protein [Chachezhania sediminis]|uniref:DUF427 domain-containing protein n=1 Tax=Chachezhania sediminis TaxID=2599291 RepID=UPI00131B5A51|nr:DUF427 domain-containing protein [Chachezhania sediminis]